MELKNAQVDTLLNDVAQGAATATLTSGNFGTPVGEIYLVFDYDVAAKYEVKRCTVAGAAITGMSHVSGVNVAHSASAKVGRMIVAEVIDDLNVLISTNSSQIGDGWVASGETWTYASAMTFTVAGDKTGKYQKGDKIKLTNSSVKYFYVTDVSYSAPNTTVTVTGGSDYSLANAAISSPYYSKIANPQGFPQWFAYTPAITGSVSNPNIGSTGTITGRFTLIGKTVHFEVQVTVGGSSIAVGSGLYRISLPINANTTYTTGNAAKIIGRANHYQSSSSGNAFLDVELPNTAYVQCIIETVPTAVGNPVSKLARWDNADLQVASGNICTILGTYEIA